MWISLDKYLLNQTTEGEHPGIQKCDASFQRSLQDPQVDLTVADCHTGPRRYRDFYKSQEPAAVSLGSRENIQVFPGGVALE